MTEKSKPELTVLPGRRQVMELNFIRKIFTPEGVNQSDIDKLKPKGKLSSVVSFPDGKKAPHQS